MEKFHFGLIGLGVMGQNFIMNIAEKGFSVLGYDLDTEKVNTLNNNAGDLNVKGVNSMDEFMNSLETPRRVMLLVPAGVVDKVVDQLTGILEPNDLIIDGGNSHPYQTEERMKAVGEKGIKFLGVGVSGGAEGARKGPSLMPGGHRDAYDMVKPVFEAAAAKAAGEPCVAFLGNGSAGHFVKMVHNGIEYGIMQLISEAYDLMKRGLLMNHEEIHQAFKKWNSGKLDSFLVGITAEIINKKDDLGDGYLLDQILDVAKQKGTGKWTSQVAMDLEVPIPTIDMAVAMRYMSTFKSDRENGKKLLVGPDEEISEGKEQVLAELGNALYFGMLIAYTQGLQLLSIASHEKNFELNLHDVVKIWRGGCIIRAALLEDLLKAYKLGESTHNILLSPALYKQIDEVVPHARKIAIHAAEGGIPIPAMMTALSYFDAYRSDRLPFNVIQAQRDYFGSHTYERTDRDGVFHTEW